MQNQRELWERYCKYFRHYPTVGISLDVSRMRFSEDYLAIHAEKIQRAFEEMSELEAGGIANPDEKRMVGHYWLRAPELAPTPQIAESIQQSITKVLSFARKIHSGEIKPPRAPRFTRALLLGIGGSALGPQLVADCLGSEAEKKLPIHFCDNTDPDGMSRVLRDVGTELSSTLVIVVSKSGGTVETANCSMEIAAAFRNFGLRFPKHAIAITMHGSKLDMRAQEEDWLDRFEMWDWVGGRTSLFSSVGLLPAALEGIDIEAMLSGARLMDEITRTKEVAENPAALLALMWHFAGNGKGEKDMVVLPYKDRLILLSRYLQQLVMESLGKERDFKGRTVHQGIAVYGNKGSTDQHAYVQQLRDGVPNFFVTFVQVLEDYCNGSQPVAEVDVKPDIRSGDYLNGFLLGTREALYENGRDSLTISLDRLSAQSLGALIALFERTVGFYASLVRVNAYDQPGVEAGKKAAERVVEIQQQVIRLLRENKNRDFSVHELSQMMRRDGDREIIFRVLEHLAQNPSRSIERSGGRHPSEVRYRFTAGAML